MIYSDLNSGEFILQGRGECNRQPFAAYLADMDIYHQSAKADTSEERPQDLKDYV